MGIVIPIGSPKICARWASMTDEGEMFGRL